MTDYKIHKAYSIGGNRRMIKVEAETMDGLMKGIQEIMVILPMNPFQTFVKDRYVSDGGKQVAELQYWELGN